MVCNAKFRADIGLKHLPFQEEEEKKEEGERDTQSAPIQEHRSKRRRTVAKRSSPEGHRGHRCPRLVMPLLYLHQSVARNNPPSYQWAAHDGRGVEPHISLPWAAYGTRLSLPMPALVADESICHGEGACKTSIHADRARSLPLRYRYHGGDAGSGDSRVR